MPGTFMFSNGDPTGYGYHGDFQNGWSVDLLGNAIQQCTNPSGELKDCPLFELQSQEEGAKCEIKMPEVLAADDCAGPAPGLCGNVPVQFGPQPATGLMKPGETGSATAAPTTIASEDIPAVPTLSYTTAKSAVTDKFGGGISVALEGHESLGADTPEPAPATPTPKVPAASSAAVAPAPETPVSAEAPAPTNAPAAPPAAPAGNIISTSIYTSAGTVYEIAIQQVEVTVTVDGPAPAAGTPAVSPRAEKHRRHGHHMHRHRF